MDNDNTNLLYMPKPPSWITKWGTLLITMIFICFVLIICFFPYPNILVCELNFKQLENENYIAYSEVELKELTELKIGQKVNIHLHKYPYSENGALTGKLSYISNKNINNLKAEIRIDIDSLVTTQHKTIEYNTELKATGNIKLKERKIINILLNN